jgi:hypothetical protein
MADTRVIIGAVLPVGQLLSVVVLIILFKFDIAISLMLWRLYS